MHVNRYVLTTLLVVCFAAGCSQTTHRAATFRQTAQLRDRDVPQGGNMNGIVGSQPLCDLCR